jgi:hypothetical protein
MYRKGNQPNLHVVETLNQDNRQNQEDIYQRQHRETDELGLLVLAATKFCNHTRNRTISQPIQ